MPSKPTNVTEKMYALLHRIVEAGNDGLRTDGGDVSGRTLRALRERGYVRPAWIGSGRYVATHAGQQRGFRKPTPAEVAHA
jgi:hypothetical protein